MTQEKHKVYDILNIVLAFAAVVFIILDLSGDLLPWQEMVYHIIICVFIVDFIVRFWRARNKRKFVKNNFSDLIVVLPIQGVLRGLHVIRSASILRLFGLPRLLALLYRPLKKIRRFLNTNGFKYILFVTFGIIVVGGVLIHFAEGMSISDGLWWAFVTATTVGYGDISPSTFYGRLIAMVLMLLGIGLIGSVTSTLTSYFLRSRGENLKDKTIQAIQEELEHFDTLSDEDVERICGLLQTLHRRK